MVNSQNTKSTYLAVIRAFGCIQQQSAVSGICSGIMWLKCSTGPKRCDNSFKIFSTYLSVWKAKNKSLCSSHSHCPLSAGIMQRYSTSPSVWKLQMQRGGTVSLRLWSASGGSIRATAEARRRLCEWKNWRRGLGLWRSDGFSQSHS